MSVQVFVRLYSSIMYGTCSKSSLTESAAVIECCKPELMIKHIKRSATANNLNQSQFQYSGPLVPITWSHDDCRLERRIRDCIDGRVRGKLTSAPKCHFKTPTRNCCSRCRSLAPLSQRVLITCCCYVDTAVETAFLGLARFSFSLFKSQRGCPVMCN